MLLPHLKWLGRVLNVLFHPSGYFASDRLLGDERAPQYRRAVTSFHHSIRLEARVSRDAAAVSRRNGPTGAVPLFFASEMLRVGHHALCLLAYIRKNIQRGTQPQFHWAVHRSFSKFFSDRGKHPAGDVRRALVTVRRRRTGSLPQSDSRRRPMVDAAHSVELGDVKPTNRGSRLSVCQRTDSTPCAA